jgi:YD repeat-containing protein
VKKLTARSTRVCTLLVMLALFTALILAATAQAVAATDTSTSDSLEDHTLAAPVEVVASRAEDGASARKTALRAESSAGARSADISSDGFGLRPSVKSEAAPALAPLSAPDPMDALSYVYVGVGTYWYKSSSSSANWSQIGSLGTTPCRAVSQPHSPYLYVLTVDNGNCTPGVLMSIKYTADWGETWSDMTSINDVHSLTIHPSDPSILYAARGGDNHGLWRSDDYGATWTRIWAGTGGNPEVMAVVGVSPFDPDLMVAVVAGYMYAHDYIRRSTDGGYSWTTVQDLGYFSTGNQVLWDWDDPDRVYVGQQYGFHLSVDGGLTWSTPRSEYTWMIAQSAEDPNVLYKIGWWASGNNIWKSTNRGVNWTQIDTMSDGFYPAAIAVSRRNPDTVFTVGSIDKMGPNPRMIYKSTNGGSSWQEFESGTANLPIYALALLETEGASHYFGVGYCPTGQCGDPVNTSTGNFAHQWDDLSIPGPGASLSVQRTYNSQDSYVGPLGEGWSLNYDMRLTSMVTKIVEMKVEDGRRDRYISSDGETFIPPPGVNATLVRNDDDSYTLTREDQTRYNFDEDGYLTSIVTSNELTTTLTYIGTRLTGVTEPAGRAITFTWNVSNTLITGIEDPLGRTVVYTYTSGDLTSVTDLRGNVGTYAYTGTNGLLSSHTEAGKSTPSFVNWYNDDGQVTGQLLAGSTASMTFEYDPDDRETTVTDARGKEQVHTYSIQLPLTDREDSYGNELHLTYDAHNNVTSVTDEKDNQTEYGYDPNGNVSSIVDALDHEQTMTYDDHNNLESLTDARDVTTEYQYDDHDNLTAITQYLDSNPITTTFTYYDEGALAGLLHSRTDPLGHTTSYGYDDYGNMTVITDALGNLTTYTYDLAGRRTSEIVSRDGLPHTIYYTYDDADNLTTITQTVDSQVVTTSYEYDETGNRVSMTDANGVVTRYEYDGLNRLVKTIQNYQYGGSQDSETNVETTYEYDNVGNRTKVTHAEGRETTYEYDDLNRLITVTDPLSGTMGYVYDEVGNQIQVTDANDNPTYYEYDELNRLITVTNALSGTTVYDYDEVGNRIQETDANGHYTDYEYDDLNRQVKVTDHLDGETTYEYDDAGNTLIVTDANDNSTSYEYDALNRQITTTNALDDDTVYSYDEVGNRISVTDASTRTTS